MPTAQITPAGEALRAMLPAGADPYATIDLACHTAFLARDRELLPGLLDVVKTQPDLAAGLIVALAALVDIDERPDDMLAWLGTSVGREQETARMNGALTEARQEYNDAAADTLPPVTLESMRAMAHAARVAGVLHPCGTTAAYSRHITAGQEPCPRCSWARHLYDNATKEERELLRTPLVDAPKQTVEQPGSGEKAVCGTVRGYDAHLEKGEQPCLKCLRMAADVVSARRFASGDLKPPKTRENCGSHGGYNTHKKQGEHVCDPCRDAQRVHDAKRYEERLARQGKTRKRTATVYQLLVAAVSEQQPTQAA